jgi:hypothetical protein
MDRWELNVGDSLIDKIQSALTESSAMLVILSKKSVASEWCKKELNAGLMRELAEKRVLVLPCVIDDCEIPLFLREKFYANFRKDRDEAFEQVNNALLRISNRQQGRLESPDFYTDWAVDWKTDHTGRWYFQWVFVDHGQAIEYCILTRCLMICNDATTAHFKRLIEDERRKYIRQSFAKLVKITTKQKFKMQLGDAFEKTVSRQLNSARGRGWMVRISSRRMGIDNGKDTLVHVDQMLERALKYMLREDRPNKS